MKVKIFVEYLFLPQFRIFGALIILFGIPGFHALAIHLAIKILLWLIVLFIGLFLLLGSQQVEIDPDKKRYRILISVPVIFNSGKWKPYGYMENLFIKKSRESQRMGIGPIENTVKKVVYNAYLKLSDVKVYLGSYSSKERLLKKMTQIKERLETSLIDYSGD